MEGIMQEGYYSRGQCIYFCYCVFTDSVGPVWKHTANLLKIQYLSVYLLSSIACENVIGYFQDVSNTQYSPRHHFPKLYGIWWLSWWTCSSRLCWRARSSIWHHCCQNQSLSSNIWLLFVALKNQNSACYWARYTRTCVKNVNAKLSNNNCLLPVVKPERWLHLN